MGYSNKRRRSKRRRTRTMSARMHSLSSSSEDSSLDHQEQSSSYASFCSTHSYHTNGSYMSNEHCIEPPDSILFLDHDDNVNSLQDHRLNIAVQNDHLLCSIS